MNLRELSILRHANLAAFCSTSFLEEPEPIPNCLIFTWSSTDTVIVNLLFGS